MSETTWCGFASATGPKAKLICGKNCTGRFSSRCGIGSSFGRLRFIPSGTPSCGRMEPTSRRSFSTPRWPHGYPAAPADRDPGAAPVGMQGRVLAAAAERRLDTEPKRGASTRGERAGNGREIAKHPTPFAPSRLRLPRDRIEGRSGLATPPAAGSCSSVTAATDSVSPLAGLAPLHPLLSPRLRSGQWASSSSDGRMRLCPINLGESFSRDRMPRTERVAVAEIQDRLVPSLTVRVGCPRREENSFRFRL